jgi:hypothetical protein
MSCVSFNFEECQMGTVAFDFLGCFVRANSMSKLSLTNVTIEAEASLSFFLAPFATTRLLSEIEIECVPLEPAVSAALLDALAGCASLTRISLHYCLLTKDGVVDMIRRLAKRRKPLYLGLSGGVCAEENGAAMLDAVLESNVITVLNVLIMMRGDVLGALRALMTRDGVLRDIGCTYNPDEPYFPLLYCDSLATTMMDRVTFDDRFHYLRASPKNVNAFMALAGAGHEWRNPRDYLPVEWYWDHPVRRCLAHKSTSNYVGSTRLLMHGLTDDELREALQAASRDLDTLILGDVNLAAGIPGVLHGFAKLTRLALMTCRLSFP